MATIVGTNDDNALNGTNDDDVIRGLRGDDFLRGRRGDDELNGGRGDDILLGGRGDDVLKGGRGDDVLLGGRGDDVLKGGRGDDVLLGGRGDDVLEGGRGDDVLRGGRGDDVLKGGRGDDVLFGGRGDDELDGGRGDDVLEGGRGDDTIATGSGDDRVTYEGNFGDDTILDFDPDKDTIDLTSFTDITDVSQLQIEEDNGDTVITVPDGGTITLKGVSPAEAVDAIEVACFVEGVMIATPLGPCAIEQLAIGDDVLTGDGAVASVKWIGRRGYTKPFLVGNDKVRPVVIRAGAIAPCTPTHDLAVSPGHAIFVDGYFIAAGDLVNHTSIVRSPDRDEVSYFHVELGEPSTVIANGLVTESYANHDSRRMFSNYREYAELYGDDPTMIDERGGWKRRHPLLEGGERLESIKASLLPQSRAA